jgi:hypothetical protein
MVRTLWITIAVMALEAVTFAQNAGDRLYSNTDSASTVSQGRQQERQAVPEQERLEGEKLPVGKGGVPSGSEFPSQCGPIVCPPNQSVDPALCQCVPN